MEPADQGQSWTVKRRQTQDTELGDGHGGATVAIRRRLADLREDDRRLRRCLDLHALPSIALLYFLLALEAGTFSYAIVLGFGDKVDLADSRLSWFCATPYLAHIVLQLPVAWILLKQFPLDAFISLLFGLFGIFFTFVPLAEGNFGGIILCRLVMGFMEASVVPTLVSVTQMFWSKEEQPGRMSCWFSMGGLATIMLSLAANLTADPTIFIVYCALVFLMFHLWTLFMSKGSPMQTKFLSEREKRIGVGVKRVLSASYINTEWRREHVGATVRDPKTWLWFGLVFCASVPYSGINSVSSLLLKSLGDDASSRVLLNVPFGVVQIISTISGGIVVTRYRATGPATAVICLVSITGFVVLAMVSPLPEHSRYTLAGYYLTAAGHGVFPLIYTWCSCNTGGVTKWKSTAAIMFTGQALGNILGPLVFTSSYFNQTLEIPFRALWTSMAAYCCVIALCSATTAHLRSLNQNPSRQRYFNSKGNEFASSSEDRLDLALDIDVMKHQDLDDAHLWDGSDDDAPYCFRNRLYLDVTDLEDEEFSYVL